jgi:hypothetical protein
MGYALFVSIPSVRIPAWKWSLVSQYDAARRAATVLIVAPDPNIASLMGELVAFAGHCPRHDPTNGAAGESVRRVRPDITIIDAVLSCPVIDSCVAACDETRTRPVLTSSVASEPELIDQAQTRGCIPFPLPGRPTTLATILNGAMRISRRPVLDVAELGSASVHPAFCAAIANIARARALFVDASNVRTASRELRAGMRGALTRLRDGRAELRAAVRDLAASLKRADVSQGRMLFVVRETLNDCAVRLDSEEAIAPIADEWRVWAIEAFRAA